MKKLFHLLTILIPAISFAQNEHETSPLDLFYKGQVVLQNKDTVKGLIKYSDQDVLQVIRNKRIETFSPKSILSFEIVDPISNCKRQFYSLPYSKNDLENTLGFFELISNGKITVMSKERLQPRTSYIRSGGSATSIHWDVVNNLFVLNEKGILERFPKGSWRWYELMGEQANAVHDYAKRNKLSFDNKYQFKSIIDYYNSLFRKQSIFSSAKTSYPSYQR